MDGMLSDSRVLVTGGAGFIGSNLADSSLLSGNFVICLCNFSAGERANLNDFTDNPNTLKNFLAPDFSKTFEKLPGYSPILNVKEGLKESVKWFWNNL
jgi:UDP-glucose 4-epimerase